MKKVLLGVVVLASVSSFAQDQQAVGENLKLGGTFIKCPLIYNGHKATTTIHASSERFQFFNEDYQITGVETTSSIDYQTEEGNGRDSFFINKDGLLDYHSPAEMISYKVPVKLRRTSLSNEQIEYGLSISNSDESIVIGLDRTSVSDFKSSDTGYKLLNPDNKVTDFTKKIKASIKHSNGKEYQVHCSLSDWR